MSEKDTVPSQDIPALVRALGTLILAAATAVAIKWFISHDTKEIKTKCDEAELQNDPCSTGQDEQTTYDDCLILDGVSQRTTNPQRTTSPPEVSDGCGNMLNLLLEGCHDSGYIGSPTETSCIFQSTISQQENGQQINLSCGSFPKEASQITSVTCTLNMVATSPENSALFIQRDDGFNASVLTATTRGSATTATENPMFSDCLTHSCDNLSYDRSASIQEPECRFGTSSSSGECIAGSNTRSSGCHCKLSSQHDPIAESFVQLSTISIGVSGDTLINRPNEKDGDVKCPSEIQLIKHITSPEDQKYNINNLVIDDDDKDNSLAISREISGRKIVEVMCNPFASAAETSTRTDACIPNCPSVPVIADNNANENDTIHCIEVLSDVQKALSIAHEYVVSADDVCKDVKLNITMHSRMDPQGINIYQLDGEQNLTLYDGKVIEISNEEHPIQDTVQNINNDDNDTEDMVLSLENGLPNKESNNLIQCSTSMDAYTGIYKAQESLKRSSNCAAIYHKEENMTNNTHCYPNNTNELPMSEEWRATTLSNYTEHAAIIYPLDQEYPNASYNIQGKQSEHQFHSEEMSVVSKDKGICRDLSKNLISEKLHEDINVNKETAGLNHATSKVSYAVTTFENNMNDSTSLGTLSSKVITEDEFIYGAKSITYRKDNTEFQNCKISTTELQEGSNSITNGYLVASHEVTDANDGCSKLINKHGEHNNEDLNEVPSEPYSSLQQISVTDSNLEEAHFCKDNNVPLPVIMGTYYTSQIGQHVENYVFQENVSIGREEQHSSVGDTFSSCINRLAKDKKSDPMCWDPNLSSVQHQNAGLTFINGTNMCSEDKSDVTHSRAKIMSAIADNPELILPEYHPKCSLVKKKPPMTKSCDNILSGHSYHEPTLKIKAQSMLCLLTEYYSSKLPSENGPVEEVARGSFIRIPKDLQSIGQAMSFQLTLGNCLDLLKLARKNKVQELLKAVYTVISDNYFNVLKNSSVYGQLTCIERERILQLRMRGKLSLCVVDTKSIFALNKYVRCPVETAECKAQLYSLDTETNQWKPVTTIPEEASLKGCSICSMHNYLFIAGGLQETTEGLTCSNKLFCYNPLTDIWTQMSPMNEGRSQLKLIPLDGYLYAIGGECLHSVEKYDPRLNKWTFVAPLPKGTFAVAHEAAACAGEIYVSGGHLFYRLLKYSPVHDQWEECPFNASKGRSCDMVAVGSILYRFDMQKDSSVNILQYNTLGKMWSEYTASIPGSKIPFRCALLQGIIYCINRETTAKFSLENEKAVFEAGVFSKVPTRGAGSPHPTVLCLRGSVSQTSV